MFNTSTLISLGLTALLCGIIMFYCKRKFAEYDQKLDMMSDLISNIITQLNQIPSSVYDNTGLANEQPNIQMTMNSMTMPMGHTEIYDESDADESEIEDEDNNIKEVEVNVNDSSNDKRIVVTLPNTFNEEVEDNEEQEDDNESWDSQEEDDEEEDKSHKITIQPHDMVITSVSLDQNEVKVEEVTEEAKGEVAEAETKEEVVKAETKEEVVQAKSEEKGEVVEAKKEQANETKVIDTSVPVDVDYNKMQVAMLKKMVAERNLAQGVSKMKKQELVNVLMNKS